MLPCRGQSSGACPARDSSNRFQIRKVGAESSSALLQAAPERERREGGRERERGRGRERDRLRPCNIVLPLSPNELPLSFSKKEREFFFTSLSLSCTSLLCFLFGETRESAPRGKHFRSSPQLSLPATRHGGRHDGVPCGPGRREAGADRLQGVDIVVDGGCCSCRPVDDVASHERRRQCSLRVRRRSRLCGRDRRRRLGRG